MSKNLRTEKLSVGYGKKCVIEGIELDIEAGKIISLIGPNGCGKTTILRTVLKQLETLAGSVYVSGKDLSDMSGDDIAHFMSMVTAKRPVTELMTCREVVATGRYPYTGRFGLLNEKDEEKVREAIEFMHVESIAEEHPELKVCKVDVDENPELAQLFNVMSIPTLAAFKDGQLSGTAVGYQSKENVLKLFA